VGEHRGRLGGQRGQPGQLRVRQPQRAEQRGGGGDGGAVRPVEATAQRPHQVVLLGPGHLDASHQIVVVPGGEIPGPLQETVLDQCRLAGLAAADAVLADRLEHAEPGAGRAVGDLQQGLPDQLLDDCLVGEVGRRGGVEAGREHRQGAHRPLRRRIEQLPAPVDHRVQGAVPFGRVPAAAPQQREPVAEPARDLGRCHRADAGGGQLHGQRKAVEIAADVRRRLDRDVGGPRRPGPLHEQFHARRLVELGQRVDHLGRQAQRRPAGGQDAEPGRPRDERAHQLGGRVDDVLAVVEHEQGRTGAEGLDDTVHVGHTEARSHLAGDVTGHAGQLHEVDLALPGLPGDGLRQPRLAEAAGSDDRDHFRRTQESRHLGEVAVPPEQLVRLLAQPPADR
jgi:hypothetical protein